MYTEGYIVGISTAADIREKIFSFQLEPVVPYTFRLGERKYTLALKITPDVVRQAMTENANLKNPRRATIFPIQALVLACKDSIADFAALVAIKASHSRIGVEFNEDAKKEKSVSKIIVL